MASCKLPKNELLQIKITTFEKQKFRRYADRHGLSMSEAFRDWLSRLPDVDKPREKRISDQITAIPRFNSYSKIIIRVPKHEIVPRPSVLLHPLRK